MGETFTIKVEDEEFEIEVDDTYLEKVKTMDKHLPNVPVSAKNAVVNAVAQNIPQIESQAASNIHQEYQKFIQMAKYGELQDQVDLNGEHPSEDIELEDVDIEEDS